jgi:Flp pilus assembly protein TadD
MDDVYELFRRGTALLERGDYHAATVPLGRAAELEPDQTSIREALGRACFLSQRYVRAAEEFEAVVDRAPTNDFALFCLGRSLQKLGRHQEARRPLNLAAGLRPDREDYRTYRDRSRRRAA